ncbi:MAG: efflux RND transporter periplasmic adaptor subunit [Alistipes sp.]|nr:efflux RND transporter periplasmic adaptor subunit [Candidatus Alistipes equi]
MKSINGILLIVFAAFVCIGCTTKNNKTQEEVKLPTVVLSKASMEDVEQIEVYTGSIEANILNKITSQYTKRILEIRYDVGDRVNSGDVLVRLESSSLLQSKVQMENAKAEYERMNELYSFGGASKSQLDAKRMAYDVALASYENQTENTTLVAPVSGIITSRNYDPGDMTSSLPILVLEQIKPVKIMINVSENLFSKVSKGMKMAIEVEAYPGEKFVGTVYRVYPTLNTQTHTFPVEVRLSNQDERVRPGMFARVTMSLGSKKRVTVEDRAIQKLPGSGDRFVYIYVPENQTVRYSKVELGRRLDNRYEVLSGIEDADQVVIQGHMALKNGAKVDVNDK